MTSLPSATPHITDEMIAEIHHRAHHLRARAFRLFGILLWRAVRRVAAGATDWLRRLLDAVPQVSPWLRHRF